MASRKQRVLALVLAVLFLITSVGTGAAVIWQINQDNKVADKASTEPTAQEQAQNQQQADASTCNIQAPEQAPAEPVPSAYKPAGDVTKLETTDLKAGTGREAKAGDCLVVKYHGTLVDGEKFDGNFDSDTALQFRVGQGNVIPGWDQGMVGIKEGGVRRLVIPSELAYGENGQGPIKPNSDLVFEVKLVKIK